MKILGAFALAFLFAAFRVEAQTLYEAEELWREQVVRYCGPHPAKEHCDDGDSLIFSGLLCMSGEELGCEAVRASQSADGQFWRSPRRNPGNLGEKNSFSRDQTLGALLYLAKTRDREAAVRWMDWIEDNKACSVKNPITGNCVITIYRVCRDGNACTVTPAIWGLFKRVWEHLGLATTGPMRDYDSADVSDLELTTADHEEAGYKLHLKAVSSFLRLSLGESVTRSRIIAQKLFHREKGNPFFQILAEGPSESVLQRVLDVCPKPGDDLGFRRYQWSWERAQSSEAWKESMGWDCIFMANLLRNHDSIILD